ncbi:MAG: hypothetical protein ACYSR9_14980, partial [Planctomycetota bacterium]
MKINSVMVTLFVLFFFLCGCGNIAKEKQLEQFIDTHVAKVEPLSTQVNLAYWDASTTGKPEDYERVNKLQLEIRQIYNIPREFAFLKGIKESGQVSNAKLARQLDKLYYAYLRNQIGPELLEKL